jgi:dienelactone hydrolase
MTEVPGYSSFRFEHDGHQKIVYTRAPEDGAGSGVLIMHELPGMVRECVALADHIASNGFTVFLPLLFGEPNIEFSKVKTVEYFAQLCVSREIHLFAENEDSPLTVWLRALARDIRRRCPAGRGVGVIGLCLTGGFVINLMVEDVVQAPVASEPSLPLTTFGAREDALGVSHETLQAAVLRARNDGVPLQCYRYTHDKRSTQAKFDRLKREFGTAFDGTEIPGDKHSVLTIDLDETARHRVVEFLRSRLNP